MGSSSRVRGEFEAHITVDTDRVDAFAALCRELGIDHVSIELAEGVHRTQPMTASHHRGAFGEAMADVVGLVANIHAAGFTVVRTKLEAAIDNEGLPTDDGYYEFHVKIAVVDQIAKLAELAALAAQHGGRLSRSERRPGQRFVTLRSYTDRATAERQLADLVAALAGYDILGITREYTVYDNRIELDAGWLEPP